MYVHKCIDKYLVENSDLIAESATVVKKYR